jgi:small subunit ribosomal protein S24e
LKPTPLYNGESILEIEILKEKENNLLFRKEYQAVAHHIKESTPKRSATRDKLAATVNADADRTVVIKIESEFGMGQSNVTFHVYDNHEHMKATELPYILKRNGFLTEEEQK